MSDAVHFNFRILREDARPITAREMVGCLRFFMAHRRAPEGYQLEVVQWMRPNARNAQWRTPSSQVEAEQAMEGFWHILIANGLRSLRLGGVKGDYL